MLQTLNSQVMGNVPTASRMVEKRLRLGTSSTRFFCQEIMASLVQQCSHFALLGLTGLGEIHRLFLGINVPTSVPKRGAYCLTRATGSSLLHPFSKHLPIVKTPQYSSLTNHRYVRLMLNSCVAPQDLGNHGTTVYILSSGRLFSINR